MCGLRRLTPASRRVLAVYNNALINFPYSAYIVHYSSPPTTQRCNPADANHVEVHDNDDNTTWNARLCSARSIVQSNFNKATGRAYYAAQTHGHNYNYKCACATKHIGLLEMNQQSKLFTEQLLYELRQRARPNKVRYRLRTKILLILSFAW